MYSGYNQVIYHNWSLKQRGMNMQTIYISYSEGILYFQQKNQAVA